MDENDLCKVAEMFLAWENALCLIVGLTTNASLVIETLESEAEARAKSGAYQKMNVLILERLAYRLKHQHKGTRGDRATDLNSILRALRSEH